MPLGTIMPNFGATQERLAFLLDLAVAATAKNIDMYAGGRDEPDDATLDLFDKYRIQFGYL